jgi:hypothetical protein
MSSVWSWVLTARGSRHQGVLFGTDTLFFAICILIFISIAFRSSFWADRVVSGALAGVMAMAVVRAVSLTPAAMFAVDVAHSAMWTIAALVSLIVLISGFKASPD